MTTAYVTTKKTLQVEVDSLMKENLSLKKEVLSLQEQIEWFKRQYFGKRSERIVDDLNYQEQCLPGLESFFKPQNTETEAKTIPAHERRKPVRNGQDAIAISPDMPVETIIIDLHEEEKFCKETGEPLVKIGEEITHKLAHKPGSYYIKEIIRSKYANKQKPEDGVITAEFPDAIIPKCKADNSLLAEIITKKFVDHLPLYRIAEGMGREGVIISRKLLSQWVIRCGEALKPLYDAMVRIVLSGENIFIDESQVKLQEKRQCKTAYMWVIVGGKSENPNYRIYNFRENRCHSNVIDILKEYTGILHSDKYGAYQKLAENKVITWSPCWSHIRRKFFEADGGDHKFREWVLRKIRYLFMLEKVAWAGSPEERLRIRETKEIPIIDELIQKIKSRLIDGTVLPKSKIREALGYFCGLIPYLKNYTKHPFSRIDNNIAERAIRPLAIGRKNWLFFGSVDGGVAGSVLFSLVQTCRGLGINPREYLEDIFCKLMGHSSNKLEELLPDKWLLNKNNQK